MSGKAKKVNPQKVPVDGASFDKAACARRASVVGLYRAWLLVLATLIEQERCTADQLLDLWRSVYASGKEYELDIRRAGGSASIVTTDLSIEIPFPDVVNMPIRSALDIRRFERRITENAVCAALMVVAPLVCDDGAVSRHPGMAQRLLLNIRITLDEISGGYSTYERLARKIDASGLTFVKDPGFPCTFNLQKRAEGSRAPAALPPE